MANPTATATTTAATALDTEFRRGLGLYDSTMIVVGAMIGSGIFIVSAEMARVIASPGWLLVAWLLTGALTVVGALSYGELAAMMPRAGGQYVYLRESYGPLTSGQSLSALRPAGQKNIEKYRSATNGCVQRYRAASDAPVVAVGGVIRDSHNAMTIAITMDGKTSRPTRARGSNSATYAASKTGKTSAGGFTSAAMTTGIRYKP